MGATRTQMDSVKENCIAGSSAAANVAARRDPGGGHSEKRIRLTVFLPYLEHTPRPPNSDREVSAK